MSGPARPSAIELFAPLGPGYDRVGALLSFGQDPRWRRAMVARIPRDGGHVLDVATGTGLVAERLLARGHRVTGLDQSPDMLAVARRRFGDRVELVEASATAIPFPGRVVRPPHVHLPPALRRRSRRDARRARARRPPGRHDREPRVLRSRAGSGDRSGTSTSVSGCRRSAASLARLVRRRPLPRPVDPRLLRRATRSSASSSCGRRPGSTTSGARRMSLGGGVVIWGTRR